jgi:DNA repair exonuclease SbcCD nuclease subunit
MTDPLFHKAACITDLHFGRGGNSTTAHADNLAFLRWFVDEAQTWGAETCLMLGDWHDNRHHLGVLTIAASLEGLEILNRSFKKVYFIAGNHDLPFRDKRDAASVEFARNYSNITLFRDPTNVGGCTFLPWLVGEEHHTVMKNVTGRYVFAHLEMPGFLMNAMVEKPDGPETVKEDQFGKSVEYIFTGHFHKRQTKGRVVYTGNIMPFDFNDANDADRGAMFLEWGKEPEFRAWPDQPLFRYVNLSDLMASPKTILNDKASVKVKVDVPITYEERQSIRDSLVVEHGSRKLELSEIPKADVSEASGTIEVVHSSVDQTVIEGIRAVDSAEISKERLEAIYLSLPKE